MVLSQLSHHHQGPALGSSCLPYSPHLWCSNLLRSGWRGIGLWKPKLRVRHLGLDTEYLLVSFFALSSLERAEPTWTKPKGFGPIPQKKQRSGRSQEGEVQGSCGLGHPAGLGTRGVQADVDKGPVHSQTNNT